MAVSSVRFFFKLPFKVYIMRYTRTITATWEPVTIDDARDHCRVTVTTDDSYLEALVAVAREKIEYDTKRCIVESDFLGYLHKFPAGDIIIQQSPVSAISKVEYLDGGSYSEWATAKWGKDLVGQPARLCPVNGESWPDADTALNTVKITFVAGYASAAAVPQRIKQAIKLLVGHWYANRQEVVTGTQVNIVPVGYENIVSQLEKNRFD